MSTIQAPKTPGSAGAPAPAEPASAEPKITTTTVESPSTSPSVSKADFELEVDGLTSSRPSAPTVERPKKTAQATAVPGIPESFPVRELHKLEAKGARGQTFLLDGGSLNGLKLTIRRVKDGDANGFELTFALTPLKLKDLIERLNKQHTPEPRAIAYRSTEVDAATGIVRYGTATGTLSHDTGHTPSDLSSAANQWALAVKGPKGGAMEVVTPTAAQAVRGQVRIDLRGDDKECSKQLEAMITAFGLGFVFAPPTPRTKRIHALMRALWQNGHAKALELGNTDIDKLKPEDLEAELKKLGFDQARIDGLHHEKVFDGHFTVVDSGQADAMRRAGARYLYSTVDKPEHVLSILNEGQKSSVQRYREGLIVEGMSTNSDFNTGGGIGVFTRLVTQSAIYGENSFSGRQYKLIQTHEQLGRTDWYGWHGDYFGQAWGLTQDNFGTELMKKLDTGSYGFAGSNELIFPFGNRPTNIQRIVAKTEDARQKLIALLKENGFQPPGGLALDEFVIQSTKFIWFGPAPYECDDPAAFVASALEKAKAGEGAQLLWFLMEGPKGPARADLERTILLGDDATLRTNLFKAVKAKGELELGPKLDSVIEELVAGGKSSLCLSLAEQVPEALFRTNGDRAAELLASHKPSSFAIGDHSSGDLPYSLSSGSWSKIFRELAKQQVPGAPRSKMFDLAIEVAAERLISSRDAGFASFLAEHPLVDTGADTRAWVEQQVEAVREGKSRAGPLAIAMLQTKDKEILGASQLALIKADHPKLAAVLKATAGADPVLHASGKELASALKALPAGSQTATEVLGGMQVALLKAHDLDLITMLREHYGRSFGLSSSQWLPLVNSLFETTKGEATPCLREVMEGGFTHLIRDAGFRERISKMDGLYEVTDPLTFVAGAAKDLDAGKPGLLKLAWLLLGPPEARAHRVEAASAILRSDSSSAKQILRLIKGTDGRLPFTAEEICGITKTLAAAKAESPHALNGFLSAYGAQAIASATADLLPVLTSYADSSGGGLIGFGLNDSGMQVLDALDARADADAGKVKSWVLERVAGELLENDSTVLIQKLSAAGTDLAGIGHDVEWAAAQVKNRVMAQAFYWTHAHYSSYAEYSKLPPGIEWLLFKSGPGGSVNEALINKVAEGMPGWGCGEKILTAFVQRCANLPDEWKAKLAAAVPPDPPPAGSSTAATPA